ncbi:cystathionine gamma-synthase [Microthyrium microscopicum]|uniref:Cystathionine gamma-synthase n=1 Tax=Microthyrium microscopicum TaxID=703497 RepID=A0A6A6U2Q1_9PEZI|nr:cystathionine gamma-synthase [Microthyrium microscopicum]
MAQEHHQQLPSTLSPSTLAIHADDYLNTSTDVAPALHVSTTFRYTNDLNALQPPNFDTPIAEILSLTNPTHVYSRLSAPNTTRLESILSALLHGRVLTYSSGLAAFHALLVYLRPNVIAVSDGYHGCHGVIGLLTKLYGLKKIPLDDDGAWDAANLGKGDVVHIETPLNPTGEAVDLKKWVKKAKERGAWVTVDATFAPPPLQDPLALGADVVMHSGTKYIGGHSDMLCGVLVTKHEDVWHGLFAERVFLGSVMGSLEGWLGVRSVRTLEVRITSQGRNATRIVGWLNAAFKGEDGASEEVRRVVGGSVLKIQHASLQAKEENWVDEQMPGGYGPVFALILQDKEMARRLPSKLALFHHATSLGGVESLIEWRRMSDSTVDERVLRVSVGLENWEDLKQDLFTGLKAVLEDVKPEKLSVEGLSV